MAKKRLLLRDVVKKRGLIHGLSHFVCGVCGRHFERGGGKEGFVKSGANNHVSQCNRILLMLAGYVRGEYVTVKRGRMVKTNLKGMSELRGQDGDHEALPIDLTDPYHKSEVRSLKAGLARRRRDGDVIDESLILRRVDGQNDRK